MSTGHERAKAPLLLPHPQQLLGLDEQGRSNEWAAGVAHRLGALLTIQEMEPRATALSQLLRDVSERAAQLEAPPAPLALSAVQRAYDEYFSTARRAPTLEAFVVGLTQATADVLHELRRPTSLTPAERSQLLAGLQTAALLLSKGLLR